MQEFRKNEVYKKVPVQECWDVTGKEPIGTRCVDVNKGDVIHPEYRSRLVAKELKAGNKREDLFAATPPLEAKKLLFSMAATNRNKGKNSRGGKKLDFIDVRRAYFNAKARRPVYVKLPPEDEESGLCGKLMKAMYGTRDAAQNWEAEYTSFMTQVGFSQGKYSPCVFHHKERGIRSVIHGDDFTLLGRSEDLDWFRERISSKYEVKFRGRLGPDNEDDKSIRILNRIVEWTPHGIRYEADQRHAEIIIKDLNLDEENSKGVTAPSVKTTDEQLARINCSEEMSAPEGTAYRGISARANYLAQDRPDISFAAKGASRHMAKPRNEDQFRIKRIGRYLLKNPRVIQ
jgi:hypothetical protein